MWLMVGKVTYFLILVFCLKCIVNRKYCLAFHITRVHRDKNYIQCTVEFKIKGDKCKWHLNTVETIGFSMWIISNKQRDWNE